MGGMTGSVECGRRPIQEVRLKKPAASFPARAFEILVMMKLCR
jgi:hypothetical protein